MRTDSGSNILAEKVDDLATRVNSLGELFQRNQDSLQDSLRQQKALPRSLQGILKQNEQYFCELKDIFCELKDMTSRRSLDHGSKDVSKEKNVDMPSKRFQETASCWQLQDVEGENVRPWSLDSRVHPEFKDAAITVLAKGSVSSHITGLKHAKPQPIDSSTQYNSALKLLYLAEWPDAVPKYKNEHGCCCRRDPERDRDSRDMLKTVFPPYLFCLLTFAGAIAPRRKPLLYFVTAFWIAFCASLIFAAGVSGVSFIANLLCLLDGHCQLDYDTDFHISLFIAFLLLLISAALSIVLVHTYLRGLLESPELRTLISSVGPGRIQKPASYWTGISVSFCVITYGSLAIKELVDAHTDIQTRILFVIVNIFSIIPFFSNALVFLVVTRAICLSYDDWTTKMLAVTTTPPTRAVQLNLLKQLKARVGLSALLTRNTRVLLLPPLLSVGTLLFYYLATAIRPVKSHVLGIISMNITYLHTLPLFFALFLSSRMGILESLVAQASLRKISDYLQHAPKGWMVGQQQALSPGLLTRAGGAVGFMVAVCTFYVGANQMSTQIPWNKPYRRFGTCADGVHSGLEQHVDCGPPESSCAQTCREKYGEYILIPASNDCADVDGYVHITTQRACTAAYTTWSRLNNRSTEILQTTVYEGASLESSQLSLDTRDEWEHADWAAGFRCGAYSMPSFIEVAHISFPALFSSWKTSKGQRPHAYLCYAGARSCEDDKDNFEEMMACPGPPPNTRRVSAWRKISGPLPTLETSWQGAQEVAAFRAGIDSNGDCAEIELRDSAHKGAQVVFTLACNVSAHVDPRARAEPTSARSEPIISCPKDNRVRLSVQSGPVTRSALIVSPTSNMTNITSHQLQLKSQHIIVNPGNTLVFVADRSSDLMTITLCF